MLRSIPSPLRPSCWTLYQTLVSFSEMLVFAESSGESRRCCIAGFGPGSSSVHPPCLSSLMMFPDRSEMTSSYRMTSSTLLHQHCLLTAGLRPLVHSRPRGKDGGQVGKSSPNLVGSCGTPTSTTPRPSSYFSSPPLSSVLIQILP